MKIIQIIDSLNTGGAEKLVLDTLPIYREKGIEMDVLVLQDNNYPFMQQLEEQNICKIYKLGKGSVYNPLHIFKIAKIIKNYDIAHVHLFPVQYWAAMANKLIGSKTKLIFTEHSTSNRRIRSPKTKLIEKKIYSLFDKIICITENVKSIILSHTGLEENKCIVIENGVNLNTINRSLPYNDKSLISNKIINTDKLIIQVSSMQEPKDQKTLISSLQYLPEHYKLILVGDGPLRKQLESHTQTLGLAHRVIFLGKRNDVPRLLKTADYVVLSSKYEGLSLSSIEGMASGKPFIASNVPGLKEIVEDYGVLFPLGDAEKLAQEILRLAKDSSFYNSIVEQCQARALEYDIETMVNKHINLYEEVATS